MLMTEYVGEANSINRTTFYYHLLEKIKYNKAVITSSNISNYPMIRHYNERVSALNIRTWRLACLFCNAHGQRKSCFNVELEGIVLDNII